MKYSLPITLCLIVFVSCTSVKKEESLAPFNIESVKIESEGGCQSDTVACATFEFVYPVFPDLSDNVQKVLSGKLNAIVDGNEGKTLEEKGHDFIEGFAKMQKEMPDRQIGWTYATEVTVLVYADTLISMQAETDSFTGGAHGAHLVSFINIEPATGLPFLLDSFLKPGYQEYLRQEGEKQFRSERGLDEGVSLEEAGYSFADNKFALSDNYGFRKEGVVFYFNNYEIASYAEGPTEIIIPYERLTGWYN